MSEFSDLLEEFAALANYIDDKEGELKEIKKARDNAKAAVLAMMSSIGITNGKSVEGHSVCMVTASSAKVADREAFMNFIFEQGDDSFITNHVSGERVKSYLDETNTLPPGVTMESVNSLRFTRAKK